MRAEAEILHLAARREADVKPLRRHDVTQRPQQPSANAGLLAHAR